MGSAGTEHRNRNSRVHINRPNDSDFDFPGRRERQRVVIRPLAGARGYRKVQGSKDVGIISRFTVVGPSDGTAAPNRRRAVRLDCAARSDREAAPQPSIRSVAWRRSRPTTRVEPAVDGRTLNGRLCDFLVPRLAVSGRLAIWPGVAAGLRACGARRHVP